MEKYYPSKIEPKWQKIWEEKGLNKTDLSKKGKFYCLVMFPYPSGDKLHVGHWYNFGPVDTYARKKKMEGFNVFEPMGFDSFGLPAENYAIKTKISPEKSTEDNIAYIIKQLKQIGAMYDWSKVLYTSHPDYYKWTQWLFLQLYKKGLAYRAKAPVNFCPSCQTVLANEQVIEGLCERCDTEVEQKYLEQWFFKITDYSEKLLDCLKKLDWPEESKRQQENWIGKSEGATVRFEIENRDREYIEVFTTRPDTLFGATYMVVAPEKWLEICEKYDINVSKDVENYIKKTKNKSYFDRQYKEKTGVFTGIYAINPANKEKIPIWVADYVLPDYGTGAIMCVPAHDQRDFEFAKKYGLLIRQVISPLIVKSDGADAVKKNIPFKERTAVVCVVKHWSEDKYMGIHWNKSDWQGFVIGGVEKNEDPSISGIREIMEETGYENAEFIKPLGGVIHSQFYHLAKNENRFAHFIPLLFKLKNNKKIDISDDEKSLHDVVWLTPKEFDSFVNRKDTKIIWNRVGGNDCYSGDGILVNSGKFNDQDSKLAKKTITKFVNGRLFTNYKLRDWLISRQRYWGAPIPIIYCKKCGEVPVSEKDLPVLLPKNVDFKLTGQSPLARSSEFVNTKCPKCGGKAKRETDTMDTFVCSSWYYLRYLSPELKDKPFDSSLANAWLPVDLYVGGREHVTMHLIYARFVTKALKDMGYINFDEPFNKLRHQGVITKNGAKMSKSRGNVVIADQFIKKYGSDAFRIYLMFMGPYDEGGDWSDKGIVGIWRFLNRVWEMTMQNSKCKNQNNKSKLENNKIQIELHKVIKKISEDIEELKFNTAIASMMEWLNLAYNNKQSITTQMLETYIKLLSVFAPHISEEIWEKLGHKSSIFNERWPKYDQKLIKDKNVTIVIQINGKVRDTIEVEARNDKAKIISLAQKTEKIRKWLNNKKIKQTIFVPNRLVNFVV